MVEVAGLADVAGVVKRRTTGYHSITTSHPPTDQLKHVYRVCIRSSVTQTKKLVSFSVSNIGNY